ncbi:MAG: type II toxin-antitoxin system VapC family toxin [Alphaproteobacteria bacterium]|nr:type II toxin-antitoxin system VapC family toxin [Alphaproteobacteria bacterium]
MILLDASVWIDHIRLTDRNVSKLLDQEEVLCHPFVVGEVGMGQFRDRNLFLAQLRKLPTAEVASDDEVMFLVERNRLFGQGIGYVDAHLLASVFLTDGAKLCTRDKRLKAAATRLNLIADRPE